MNTTDKVKQILQELSGMENIEPGTYLQGDLALDSLAMVTLLIEIEDIFQIELNESDMNPYELNTAEDVVGLIERYCGDKNE